MADRYFVSMALSERQKDEADRFDLVGYFNDQAGMMVVEKGYQNKTLGVLLENDDVRKTAERDLRDVAVIAPECEAKIFI